MSGAHQRFDSSSQPHTQAEPIVIDDDDDDDVVFAGISHSPPSAIRNLLDRGTGSSHPSGSGSAIPRNVNGQVDGLISNATAGLKLDAVNATPAGPSQSISPALLSNTTFTPAKAAAVPPPASNSRGAGTESTTSPASSSQVLAPRDRYPTGLVYDVLMMLHSNPIEPEHPEDPIRIQKIFGLLQSEGCVKRMKRIPTREVLKEEVMLIHEAGIWDGLERSADFSRNELANHTNLLERMDSLYVNEHSALAARLSCGGAIELCDAIASGRVHNGFAIIRPPGHHAEPTKSMGFCFYNNVAVATRFLQEKYKEGPKKVKKVLILDWDVHHGNGTQRAFEDDADVLYISLHRYEDGVFYPGGKYGSAQSVGSGDGRGRSVNVPWPCAGMGDGDYLYAFDQVVMPIAREFSPDFVIVSAGFDAAEGDPIGENLVTPTGYALMTHMLTSLAEGRLAVILEGGYNPDAIANSALEVTKIILREPPPRPRVKTKTVKDQKQVSLGVTPKAKLAVDQVKRVQSEFWRSIVTPALEANDADGEPRTSLSELLRAHRRYELYKRFDLLEVPIDEKFHHSIVGNHAMASDGLLEKETVVLFAHDMGNLRADPPSLNSTAQGELAYIVDSSVKVLEWAHQKGYGIVDVNVLQQMPDENIPVFRPSTAKMNKALLELYGGIVKVLEHIYDNVLSISQCCKNVVLIGHGLACFGILDLISERPQLTKSAAAVVQVLGLQTIPEIEPNQPVLRKWYWNHSKVIAPALHSIWLDEDGPTRRMGRVEASRETKAVKVLSSSFDDIAAFVDKRLAKHRSTPRNADLIL